MMQCNRRCLRKGGCSENRKEREKKTIRRGTRTREENDQKRYKDANKECKRVVAIAKENAYS